MSPVTGVGKVWSQTLRALEAAGSRLRFADPAVRWRRPDVWLSEGHLGPLGVAEPVVACLHEAPWTDPELAGMLSAEWVARYGPPSTAAAAEAAIVLAPSRSSASQLAGNGADPARIRIVPYGVDHWVFHPDRVVTGREIVRAAGGRTPYVLSVATAHRRKNLAALVEAVGLLPGAPHLVVVTAPSPDRAASAPVPEDATTLTGLDELALAAVMSGASVYCQPSLMEGFGLPVLEAMACGVPVVVSDRGPLPEVVGPAGVVVEPSPAGIAAGLSSALDRGAELAEAALVRSREFSWERTAQGWLAAAVEAAS
jgi:glycosyltransferase involved in cell wall biosynthesis